MNADALVPEGIAPEFRPIYNSETFNPVFACNFLKISHLYIVFLQRTRPRVFWTVTAFLNENAIYLSSISLGKLLSKNVISGRIIYARMYGKWRNREGVTKV